MKNLTFKLQRAAFVPDQLQGCCIRQCLMRPQPIKKQNDKKQKKQNKDQNYRENKRRLSLFSIQSSNVQDNTKPSSKGLRQSNLNCSEANDNVQLFEKRRSSLLLIDRQKGKQNQNQGVQFNLRKGLKVMLAQKIQSAPQTKKLSTPFRVNIERRPSSTLENYRRQNQSYQSVTTQSNRADTSLTDRFVTNQPSLRNFIENSNRSSSKRASTPSKHPIFSHPPSLLLMNHLVPGPFHSPNLSSFCIPPESFRMIQLKQKNPILQNTDNIQMPSLIEGFSQIIDKKNGIQIVPDNSKATQTLLGTSRFPYEFDKQEFHETKRPQQKIRRLQQYFKRGGYRGSGRIASTYIVGQKQTGYLFASKQVFKKTVYQKDMTIQMQRQIANHYLLANHKNIVSLYQVFEDFQRFYFILELGQCNLRSLMGTAVDQKTCRKYIKDILVGLQFLHQNGIIHRHLKPQNVIMFYDCCKLTDFGWAPKLLYMNNHSQIPEYCSPQVLKQQPYNHKTDLWSVGIIAYQLITGIKPFNAFTQDYTLDITQLPGSKSFKKLILRLLQPIEDKRATITQALKLLSQ